MMEALQNAPEQRPAGRSRRIGQQVVRATMDLISEEGLAAVTFERVAARGAVNRGTLYRRWGNKSRLLTWVMLEFMAERAPTPDTGSLDRDLLAVMMNLDAALTSPAGAAFAQVILVEPRHDDAVAAAVSEFWKERLELARPIYTRAIERGELDGEVEFEFLVDLVFGPFFYRVMRTGRSIDEAYARRIIDATLVCMRAR